MVSETEYTSHLLRSFCRSRTGQAQRIVRGVNRAERIHAIRRNPYRRQRQADALKILASGRSVER